MYQILAPWWSSHRKYYLPVFTLENLETSLKVSTVIISFDKYKSDRPWAKNLVLIKSNSIIMIQTDLIL